MHLHTNKCRHERTIFEGVSLSIVKREDFQNKFKTKVELMTEVTLDHIAVKEDTEHVRQSDGHFFVLGFNVPFNTF